MIVVLMDIGADAIKTGMLASVPVVRRVADVLRRYASSVPVVVDPVMVAKGGQTLLDADAVRSLALELLPIAALLTPNIPEAEVLAGIPIAVRDDMSRAADSILAQGAAAVLIKGGHLPGDSVFDLLRTADGEEHRFEHPRLESRSTHGTGCTLASAIAAGIAEGLTLGAAVERARAYVFEAIRTAPGLGKGHGPLNHGHPLQVATS
jgi:hydroxymethylpyrimidine/phosphomethylpyrimidine kinase